MNFLKTLRYVPYKARNPETTNYRDRVIANSGTISEASLDAIDLEYCWTRPIRRGNPPSVFTVASELMRIADRVLLLHVGRAAAVREIVDLFLTHELITNSAKVDPHVRELMHE